MGQNRTNQQIMDSSVQDVMGTNVQGRSKFTLLLWHKIVLVLAGLGLLLLSFEGLWDLISAHAEGVQPQGEMIIFWSIALMFISLLLLGILLGVGALYMMQSRLATGFQTRLDQLQNRLSYREDLLRLIADHQPGNVAIFDRHNRYWFINQKGADRIGKPISEIIGKPPIRVLDNDNAKRLEVRLAEARVSDESVKYVDRIVDSAGETKFMQAHYESIDSFAELSDCVFVSEEDLTSLIIERERRESMLQQIMDTLVAVVDRRDPYAAGHSSRVGHLSFAIASELGLDKSMLETSKIAGSLMNFGKVLVSRSVLTKTSPLTPDELQRVRDSILTSADILAIIGFDGPVVPTLRQVLERYDGNGVPEGLKGDDILITARVVAAANAFVALISPRAHRDGLSLQDALKQMTLDSGKIYDQRVLLALSHYIETKPEKIDWLVFSKKSS